MEKIILFLFVIGISLIISFILALPVMLLWNWLIPKILFFKVSQIGFLEAWGLNLLCAFLFKTTINKKE